LLLAWAAALAPAGARADDTEVKEVHLDFQNAELTTVIDTIAKLTGTNFIYDDRVRGRVTIISPTPMPVEQAYAVFESVLQVKGFTTVKTPGGALKVIPLRDAKETNVQTSRSTLPPRNRDTFITRLIPLRYINAESIVTTLKPLVSKEAAIAAYAPTNTVILTESASNIRRLIAILESIDIETYREELIVIRVEFADAGTLANQISEIFGATASVTSTTAATQRRRTPRRGAAQPAPAAVTRTAGDLSKVRIITDERTNSLIVLAPRTQLEEVRRLVRKLDVPVTGGGRIHVYYLQHADAEELAQTLSAMISGTAVPAPPAGAAGGQAQAIRATVTGLAGGIGVTADPATNSLVIQASQEGFTTIAAVIEKLDVARPQVLVEALIMEVDVTDNEELGFNALVKILGGDTEYAIALGSDAATAALLGPGTGEAGAAVASDLVEGLGVGEGIPLLGAVSSSDLGSNNTIDAIIRLAASDAGTNIISAPHILTSDNEEAEIRVGDNIPIVTSRVDAATGNVGGLSTSVNVERQDIGVTLRVTPQITEGDTLRLDIFQEISAVNEALTLTTAVATGQSGVALSKRTVENTVVVADGETVAIGGLIGEDYQDTVVKVPWLGDIPVLGWAFKTTQRTLVKKNLLVFLTPHIIRSKEDLEKETIRKRQEFVDQTGRTLRLTEREQAAERKEMAAAAARGEPYEAGRGLNPVRHAVLDHEARYPLERMQAIERRQQEEAELRATVATVPTPEYFLQAGLFGEEAQAMEALTTLIDLGYDGTLISGERGGELLYEVRVGPYDDLDAAQAAIRVLERSQGLAPSVLVVTPEAP
jgi:general secretion pathway protein D